MNTTKIQTAFRFDEALLIRLKAAAKRERRSLNNYVETILYDACEQPNATTLQAFSDAENDIDIKPCDTSSLESFINSMR